MDALIELDWRVYPASVLMAAGVAVLLWGVRLGSSGRRLPTGDPAKILAAVQGFRVAVIGIALAGVGAAWAWHVMWLFVLSLVFGGEELLESTTHISILKRGPRPRSTARDAAVRPPDKNARGPTTGA